MLLLNLTKMIAADTITKWKTFVDDTEPLSTLNFCFEKCLLWSPWLAYWHPMISSVSLRNKWPFSALDTPCITPPFSHLSISPPPFLSLFFLFLFLMESNPLLSNWCHVVPPGQSIVLALWPPSPSLVCYITSCWPYHLAVCTIPVMITPLLIYWLLSFWESICKLYLYISLKQNKTRFFYFFKQTCTVICLGVHTTHCWKILMKKVYCTSNKQAELLM